MNYDKENFFSFQIVCRLAQHYCINFTDIYLKLFPFSFGIMF